MGFLGLKMKVRKYVLKEKRRLLIMDDETILNSPHSQLHNNDPSFVHGLGEQVQSLLQHNVRSGERWL